MYVIRIIGLVNGDKTPLDGKLLKAYRPEAFRFREWIESDAELAAFLAEWIEATDDRGEAMQFTGAVDAFCCYMQTGVGIRPDGKENRPLTAFTVGIEPLHGATGTAQHEAPS